MSPKTSSIAWKHRWPRTHFSNAAKDPRKLPTAGNRCVSTQRAWKHSFAEKWKRGFPSIRESESKARRESWLRWSTTGAGKTAGLMKLAASDMVRGKKLRLLSLDSARSAGQILLQAFATNLGHSFSSVPSIHALPAVVAEARKKEIVFIDTPGYAGNDGRTAELAAMTLEKIPGLDVHLVAPAYMKSSDFRRCIQKYDVFRPGRLLATKLDETQALGSIFSEASRAGLSLSFLAHGPAIPEDIRTTDVEDLIGLALGKERTRAQVT